MNARTNTPYFFIVCLEISNVCPGFQFPQSFAKQSIPALKHIAFPLYFLLVSMLLELSYAFQSFLKHPRINKPYCSFYVLLFSRLGTVSYVFQSLSNLFLHGMSCYFQCFS